MIINSLLDCDFYKLTMGQLIFSKFQGVQAEYKFNCRNAEKIDFHKYVDGPKFEREILKLGELSLTVGEVDYLRSLNLFSETYIDFLSNKPLNPNEELFFQEGYPYVDGEWYKVMLYETFILSIANQLYYENYCQQNNILASWVLDNSIFRLREKIDKLNTYFWKDGIIPLVEFGTRRRINRDWQQHVIVELKNNDALVGTSNVDMARRLNIQVKGTMAHELFMAAQALYPIQESQKEIFKLWKNFYNGKLAIALTDTLGTSKFLNDFDFYSMVYYDGLRHDSGDPDVWAMNMLNMYKTHGLDPKNKTLFFSDGLTVDKMMALYKRYRDKAKLGFGIGTHLTNDSFIPVPQSVMKITECNGQPVAKLSDEPGKETCKDSVYLDYLKHAIKHY